MKFNKGASVIIVSWKEMLGWERLVTTNLDDQWPDESLPPSIHNERDIVKVYGKLSQLSDNDGHHKYALLSDFALKFLSLPASNAQAEHLFLKIGSIKTELRNKLKRSSLNALICASEYIKTGRRMCQENARYKWRWTWQWWW